MSRRERHIRILSKKDLVASRGFEELVLHHRRLGVPMQNERQISGVLALLPFRAVEPCAELGGCIPGDRRDTDGERVGQSKWPRGGEDLLERPDAQRLV